MGNFTFDVKKAKGTSDATQSDHIERKVIPHNADPTRTHLNMALVTYPDGVNGRDEAIAYRLKTAGIKRKITNDQVRVVRIVMSGTHEDMMAIYKNGKLGEWCQDSIRYLYDTFGWENVVSVHLHMDEKTPHIHTSVVPIVTGERRKAKKEQANGKRKSVATDAATALASGVSSLFGSGKMKSLERKNEDLRDEIAIRNETIERLQSNIKQMEVEHRRAMMNKDNEHRKAIEAKEAEHKEETNTLNSIINTAHRWYPDFANLLRLERLAKQIGLSAMDFAELFKGKIVNFTGQLFSSEHNRWFATDNTPLQILRDNNKRLTLIANRIPISQWFSEQYDKLRQSIRQPIQPKKSRGINM